MGIWREIRNDFAIIARKDPAMCSRIELFFNYPGLVALVHYRFAHALYVHGWCMFARMIMGFTQFITNIDIHPAAQIGSSVFIDHGIGVVIGETAIVGDNVTIYQGVSLGGVSLERTKRHPTICDGVVIGAGAKVLGNITIGQNAKIGANSVVICSVPENSTAVGIPAKILTKENKHPYDMGKIPDISKQLFVFLLQRVQNIETSLKDTTLTQQNEELEKLYDSFLKSLRE
ncbi:MAG: serine O-acetyltransferase [Helicobacter sp.]|nr:serine O-acetyltransferase [Helicobacter sp.]MDE6044934.1 serine O-acetyltransferase [Helicobacter sp.]MDE7195904.1 serine O-acetyltransferase [Helicobacter sp.]